MPDEWEDALPVTGTELTAAVKTASALRRLLHKPPPEAVLRLRATRRQEIRGRLGTEPEVLVVNAKKHQTEGKLDNRLFPRGASDSFKAEIKEAGTDAFEWYSAVEYVRIKRGRAYRTKPDEHGARRALIVGRLPYERIVHIDWEPDPATGSPRFYVPYNWRHEPGAATVLYEDAGSDYEYEMVGIKFVGDRLPARLWHRFQHARFAIQWRRDEKRERDERYR